MLPRYPPAAPITADTLSSHNNRLPRLPNNNSLHDTLTPDRRPAPQRRHRALPETPPQNPTGRLQPLADIPPRQPVRLGFVHDIDEDLARPEGSRVGKAHVGIRVAAEGVGR